MPAEISLINIRKAQPADGIELLRFDHVASTDEKRRAYINRTIEDGTCYVALDDNRAVGYAVLTYSFYENGMIEMLYVHPDYRRKEIGLKLVHHLEIECVTKKLFTSTNESNKPMLGLLKRAGFEPSGTIFNLDDDGPELIFYKRVRG